MNYHELDKLTLKVRCMQKSHKSIIHNFFEKHEKDFAIKFTHESTMLEGNTLTLAQTRRILNGADNWKDYPQEKLREIHEVENHYKAYCYIKDSISRNQILDERLIKNIHGILLQDIIPGGEYRRVPIMVAGSGYDFPLPEKINGLMGQYSERLREHSMICGMPETIHPCELAAWTHAEFVTIHPFLDGNGRVSRLLMNYQLMQQGYLPISISAENRLQYYQLLEDYHFTRNIKPYADFLAQVEKAELVNFINQPVLLRNNPSMEL